MKITDVKTFVVDCFRTNWVFVKVYTDEGIAGVGEGTLEYKEHALEGAVEHLKNYLLGKDPRNIERLYHDIYRDAYWRGGAVLMSALSAVECAPLPRRGGLPYCRVSSSSALQTALPAF